MAHPLDRARELSAREHGLAVTVTQRTDRTPRASVVNAAVISHPLTGELVVSFVSLGSARKLDDLRARPDATVVFRSGWNWVAVEGPAQLVGPDDPLEGLNAPGVGRLIKTIYAAATGGTVDQWADLDSTLAHERHTAVLIRPRRVYPTNEA